MESELNKIYLINFLVGLSNVASVVYTLYFLNNGISQTQIGLLFGIFMISMSIFNIPTGAFADVVGHKISIVLGLIFHSLNGLIFYMFPTYPGMVIGMLAAGLGLALQTGAWSSLTFEILEKYGKVKNFVEISGKASAYFAMAGIIGSLIGAPIYKYAPKLPFLLFFITIGLAALLSMTIRSSKITSKVSLIKMYKTTLEGIKYTVTNQRLIGLMLLTLAFTSGRMLMNQNISQPYQLNIGLDLALVGVTAAIVQVIQMFISRYSYKIAEKFGYYQSLIYTLLLVTVATFLMSKTHNIFGLGLLFVFYTTQAYKEPIAGYLSLQIFKATHRATMVSTSSVLSSVCVGLLLPIGGSLIDKFGINYALMILSVWIAVIGGLGMGVYKTARS